MENKLVQIGESWRETNSPKGQKRTKAKYRCYCGNEFVTQVYLVRSGRTRSCRCLWRQRMIEANTTHGMEDTRLGRIWRAMKQRCYYKKYKLFERYGGRGIKICDEWLDDNCKFFEWALANGYSDDLTIDRIDNDGNYTPDNCRWVTRTQQNRNTSRTKMTMVKARIARRLHKELGFSRTEIARRFGVAPSTIGDIINNKTWRDA